MGWAFSASARQLRQILVIEDLRHKTHAVMAAEFTVAVGMGDNARAFLPAMLQRVEPKEGDLRRVGMTEDGEDAAFILGTVLKNGSRRR
jgi:hypothetical protein